MRIPNLLTAALLGAVSAGAYSHGDEPHAGESHAHAAHEQRDFGQPGDPAQVQRTIRIEMSDELEFVPARISVRTGEVIRFEVVNLGKHTHELVLGTRKELDEHNEMMKAHPHMKHDEPSMIQLAGGKSGSLVWQFTQPGEFYYGCLVEDHYDLGMWGTVYVTGEPVQAAATHGSMEMNGALGPYPMSREASGTAWQPDSSPHSGIESMVGDWMTMTHGFANLVYDRQGGPRGDHKTFSSSMLMTMGQRSAGAGTLGLRAMLSADPLMGKSGYPLLLQTGETADGRTPLIDRQHPHDLFMELSTSYSMPLSDTSSAFIYAGLPGEPALGPATFMHRFSGEDNPEAPISHHWLDSTHITYGVVTLGYVHDRFKIEGSAFRGREPDQSRYNIETGRLDSASVRLSYNPAKDWSLQASRGHIRSPEQLEPGVNVDRTTASATYNRPFSSGNWQTTLAFGRNAKSTGATTNAWLLESALMLTERHTFFARAERTDKDDLFDAGAPLAGETFQVGKVSAGYIYDVPVSGHFKLGFGGLISKYSIPGALQPAYESDPTSVMLFARIKIQ